MLEFDLEPQPLVRAVPLDDVRVGDYLIDPDDLQGIVVGEVVKVASDAFWVLMGGVVRWRWNTDRLDAELSTLPICSALRLRYSDECGVPLRGAVLEVVRPL